MFVGATIEHVHKHLEEATGNNVLGELAKRYSGKVIAFPNKNIKWI
jgi:hypothetical protein